VVLFSGKFQPRKRAIDLIEAIIALRDTALPAQPYLLLAGDGELRPQIEAAAGRMGDNSIRLLGSRTSRRSPRFKISQIH
jgi:glycosyltransferase involved in cell wall biosynthesis